MHQSARLPFSLSLTEFHPPCPAGTMLACESAAKTALLQISAPCQRHTEITSWLLIYPSYFWKYCTTLTRYRTRISALAASRPRICFRYGRDDRGCCVGWRRTLVWNAVVTMMKRLEMATCRKRRIWPVCCHFFRLPGLLSCAGRVGLG